MFKFKLTQLISFVSILAIIISFATVSVSAETVNDKQYLTSGFENAVINAWKNHSTEINVSSYGYTVSQVASKYQEIYYENPQYFYVSGSCNSSYDGMTGIVKKIIPEYYIQASTYKKYIEKFNAQVKRALTTVTSSMSDYRKALTLHDYLVQNCDYAENMGNMQLTAYGAIVSGSAVCQGYSFAYNYLLSRVGIDSAYIRSDSMNHAWSVVKLGSDYYHVDITWDDPNNINTGKAFLGRVSHTYFLLSDDEISNLNHYGWVSNDNISCTNTKYDNSIIRNINSPIYYYSGYYYMIYNSNLARTKSLSTKPTKISLSYTVNSEALLKYKSYLYICSKKKIYRYNLANKVSKAMITPTLTSSKELSGMIITKSNKLKYSIGAGVTSSYISYVTSSLSVYSYCYPGATKTSAKGYKKYNKITWNKKTLSDGYRVYRKKAGGSYSLIKTLSYATTSFNDTTALKSTKYYYYVVCYKGLVNSGKSNIKSATRV